MLDDSVDAFRMPRARLHWQLTSRDHESFERHRRCGAARSPRPVPNCLPLDPPDEPWTARMLPAAHHMGTTRMHEDPARGVDPNCRVHGTSNVFVAGSSIFPTAGWAPLTLTIVALALRLADHLRTVSDVSVAIG